MAVGIALLESIVVFMMYEEFDSHRAMGLSLERVGVEDVANAVVKKTAREKALSAQTSRKE
jgi:hypothetical protein